MRKTILVLLLVLVLTLSAGAFAFQNEPADPIHLSDAFRFINPAGVECFIHACTSQSCYSP